MKNYNYSIIEAERVFDKIQILYIKGFLNMTKVSFSNPTIQHLTVNILHDGKTPGKSY